MDEYGYEPFSQRIDDVNPALERRLTVRLLAYWESLREGRAMPTENDINPDRLNELWDDCFLLHTQDLDKDGYNFIYLGESIRQAFTGGNTLQSTPHAAHSTLNIKQLSPNVKLVLERKKPVILEGSAYSDIGQLIKYRQCLLPLGQADKVLAIFGGMRCKIYP